MKVAPPKRQQRASGDGDMLFVFALAIFLVGLGATMVSKARSKQAGRLPPAAAQEASGYGAPTPIQRTVSFMQGGPGYVEQDVVLPTRPVTPPPRIGGSSSLNQRAY